jgi:hypothetical protein
VHPDKRESVKLFLGQLLLQRIVAIRSHKEASVLKLHLAVLKEIVQHRQYITLNLFEPLNEQHPSFNGRRYHALVPPLYSATADDFPPLLQITLGGVTSERNVLNLPIGDFAEAIDKPAS